MAAITLGLEWVMKLGRRRRRVWYKLNRHIICFGPTRSGKGVTLEIPNLLRIGARRGWFRRRERMSIISIDPKGQNAAVTGRWRRKVGKVVLLNPLNQCNLGSAGFNPLAALLRALRNKSPRYFEDASAIAEALIKIQGKDPFFDLMARGLVLALILWEVKNALDQDRVPLLENVRGMLTGNLPATATAIFNSGDFQMASLAGRYRETSKTNDSIIASADAQTQWMLSRPVLDDLAKDGIDFASLKKEATTVYVIPPADALQTYTHSWFTYYFWLDDTRAPDFARTVEIHRKPGYDPVELFVDPAIHSPKLSIGWRLAKRALGFRTLMDVIPLDAGLVKGSHGRLTEREDDGPLVISSDPDLLVPGPIQATAVKPLILDHLFDR